MLDCSKQRMKVELSHCSALSCIALLVSDLPVSEKILWKQKFTYCYSSGKTSPQNSNNKQQTQVNKKSSKEFK